jgi:hypothetical protein
MSSNFRELVRAVIFTIVFRKKIPKISQNTEGVQLLPHHQNFRYNRFWRI